MDSSDSSENGLLRLSKVPLGISLMFYSLELAALAGIPIFVMPVVRLAYGVIPSLLTPVMHGLPILLLVAGILGFVGKALCLTAPTEMRGRHAIYLAVILEVLATSVFVTSKFVTVPKLVAGSSSLLAIAALACFLLFLEELGRFLHDDDLASRSAELLKLGIVFVANVVLMLVCAVAIPVAAFVLGIGVIYFGLLGVIRYARLLLDFKRKLAPS